MKNILMSITCSVVLLFVSVGCTKAPSCTDKTVKEGAIDLARTSIRNSAAIQWGSYDNLTKAIANPKVKPEDKQEFQRIVDSIDSQIGNLTLNNIRVTEKKNDVKMTVCSGDLTLSNGKTVPINYSAQYTEDGKVYVKVF